MCGFTSFLYAQLSSSYVHALPATFEGHFPIDIWSRVIKTEAALANCQLQTALEAAPADTSHSASAHSGQLHFRWVTWCMRESQLLRGTWILFWLAQMPKARSALHALLLPGLR